MGTVLLAVMAAALMAVMAGYGSASAQVNTEAVPGTTITVNTKEDELNADGDCSLREAIEAADTNAPVDKCKAGSATEEDGILFSLGKKATIVLSSTLPRVTDPSGLTIDGQKAKITVSGNDAVRVFEVGSGAVFNLRNLTVADGFAISPDPNGAGLLNLGGTVKVTNSTFSGNTVEGTGGQASIGGAISNDGTLEVNNSTFSKNSATRGLGGGIANNRTVTVTNSTFSKNSATQAAAYFSFSDGTATITNSTFSENSASISGGTTIEASFGGTTLRSTIVANPTQGSNCSSGITDGGYNIDDGTTCNFSEANNSMPSTNPLLDPKGLQDNLGPTKTIQILKGSPATSVIPEGTNGCGTTVTTDQRSTYSF